MPKRNDIHRVLIIGSGPIVIGQACEFDYSGTQACKALREEGIGVVLVNSNPATIMTDPEFADRTYIEPVKPETVDKILRKERERGTPIDSLLPTLGGQTGLNTAMECHKRGILDRHGVKMLAATPEAIHKAEDRQAFRDAMIKIGLDCPRSRIVDTWEDALKAIEFVKLPCAIRPAFTLGGSGGGFATTPAEFEEVCKRGMQYSPIHQVLIEESLWGWKEYELEVMRDRADNVVIICPIENFDPMGVHTGDSITVAPAQTLTDREYQRMRDASIAIIREIGVETGGSNIQFAVSPTTGRMTVIEMNPRVSRSSALASKATGFPIARIATKLAIGYTLDEIPNDITKTTPACFEPAIDYVVVKVPRWTFEKFPEADETLTTQMKSVGEAMSIGRTFKESLQKCVRSMEIKRFGLGLDDADIWLKHQRAADRRAAREMEESAQGVVAGSRAGEAPADETEEKAKSWPIPEDVLLDKLKRPAQGRLYYIRYALKMGWTVKRINELSHVDPWFLENMRQLVEFEEELARFTPKASKLLESAAAAPRREFDERDRLFSDPDSLRALASRLIGEDTGASAAAQQTVTALLEDPRPTAAKFEEQRADWEEVFRKAKSWGYSDVQLAHIWGVKADAIRTARKSMGLEPVYKLVDTCAAEFEAATPYYYSTYERAASIGDRASTADALGVPLWLPEDSVAGDPNRDRVRAARAEDEIRVTNRKKVVVLGGGPNRIGQGIEFDYCCVHAALAAKELGFEAIMVNSNPETVSTDYDTSDLLFFEPLTHEDVLNICERLNGRPLDATGDNREGLLHGVICQFGGQTPLNLAMNLKKAGVPIIGTSPESIALAEDRELFAEVLNDLGLQQTPNGIARSFDEAASAAARIGYPVLVRPSFVLGGRAMEICNTESELRYYMTHAVEASGEHPVLVDKFLSDATEVDVDAVSDGKRVIVAGVMEHIEQAGIHSGDSSMSLPPYSLSAAVVQQIRYATIRLALRLKVIGLMNVQYAIKDEDIYVLEVNPRASRTVPFVAKATGVPWARIAAKVMMGKSLRELGVSEPPARRHLAMKVSVFPFNKFPGVDVVLGPEMRSTGEVMGVDERFSVAFAKGQMAAGVELPVPGPAIEAGGDTRTSSRTRNESDEPDPVTASSTTEGRAGGKAGPQSKTQNPKSKIARPLKVFISVNKPDRAQIAPIAAELAKMGFELVCTAGTGRTLQAAGLKVTQVKKVREGDPNPLQLIQAGEIALVINTPGRTGRQTDEGKIRAAAAIHRVPMFTTLTGARAAVAAIGSLKRRDWDVYAIQDLWA